VRTDASDIIAIVRGFRDGADTLEELRIERIRNSDILIDGPILQDALDSAKYLGMKKPTSGLVELRQILSKMGR
jgi:hypothetical protein